MATIHMKDVELHSPQVIGSTPMSNMSADGLRQRSRGGGFASNVEDEYEVPDYAVEQQALDDTQRQWGILTCVASGLDIVASTTILVVAFKYAYKDNGVSLYCMGFQALSHELSSILLLTRMVSEMLFYRTPEGADACLLRRHRRGSLLREQGWSVFMGIVMLISSASLLFKAFRKLRFWDKWYLDHANMDQEAQIATDWLAWWGFGIYSLQALFRFFAGRKLRQTLVWHCFVASVVSLLYLLVLGIAALEEKEWSWKAEPIAAIVLAFVTLVEGIRIIYYHFDDMDERLNHDARA